MASMFNKATAAFSNRSNGSEPAAAEEGESLTTILRTHEDRGALTLLIADCTEAMKQAIEDAFDANETGTNTDLVVDDLKEALPEVDSPKQSEDETISAQDAAAQQKLQEKEQKELAQREKELSEARVKELKTAAIEHWDQWRSSVIQRLGEVLNSHEEEEMRKKRDDAAAQKEQDQAKRAASPPMKFERPPKYDKTVNDSMTTLYPPIDNPLRKLTIEQRTLILHCLLLLLLSLEHYHAESRVLLLRLSTSLDLPIDVLGEDESKVARGLLAAAENMTADEETKKKAEENKSGRKWKVGLATVAGAALIGVTGGLAAPLLAAGVGTVLGGVGLAGTATAGLLGTLAGSGVLVGSLFGAYGGRMTGKMMDQYAREIEDFAFEPVRSHHRPRKIEKEYRRLRVAIGISGWLTKEEEVVEPWKIIGAPLEAFALRWELEALMNLGNSITTLVTSAAWAYAKTEIIKRTLLGALSAGLWPLAILKVGRIIDNPFSVANYRARKCGEVLADALINKAQGERPVTLVGYSLGGKVIYSCLKQLAERKAFGLVENAILIGTPAPSTAADWRMIRSVVAGRVVNIYSTNDYVLGFLYRSQSVALGIAGLQAVEHVKGVENVDVSSLVNGHTRYRFLTGPILKQIGFEDVDIEGLEAEQAALKEQDEKESREREENEAKEKGKGGSSDDVSEEYVQGLEKQVEKKNEQSYVGWAQSKMVSAGSSVSAAYDKATAQWRSKSSATAGKEGSTGLNAQTVDDQAPALPKRPE
ncbi:Putative alpha/Beta hydrolase [Septoria linicola]|uniref:Alpha/Beta hydrolase n=1 Tax=Septoria linicola TaxID=215465 RepID=A0A9Q9EGE1_9PEZI|nr:Putative alpha/Beta hydrolase [Septoria linicola]